VAEGQKGYCKTRQNVGGSLYTLVYGDLSALESRPIEIKPFFHYWPGSTALTFSTWSCNFDCPWCQNHHLSRTPPGESVRSHGPEEILAIAERNGDQGLCASFQEPTLGTEFALDLFPLGRSRELYACYVSNGYMTPEALTLLAKSGLDGLKIDLKGPPEVYRTQCGDIHVDRILRNARAARKLGIHVEIVNLVITGVNDDQPSIEWVVDQHMQFLGQDVPLHFTRYHPAHRSGMPPTPIAVLEDAVRRAERKGVSLNKAFIAILERTTGAKEKVIKQGSWRD
jgi:pyruvate formate lyase activating enzyme